MKHTPILLIAALFTSLSLFSCNEHDHTVIIQASSWPDGTRISAIADNAVVARSSVYGTRTSIQMFADSVKLRAAHPEHLTLLTETVAIGDSPFFLPVPVLRRTFGSWRFGLTLNDDINENIRRSIIVDAVLAVTTITLISPANQDIELFRNAGIECMGSIIGVHEGAIIEDMELGGADGISVTIPGGDASQFVERLGELREQTRVRGMSLSVSVPVSAADTGEDILRFIHVLFGEQPAALPDEIRLQFTGDQQRPVVSAEEIVIVVSSLMDRGYSASLLAVELHPAFQKYHVTDEGHLVPSSIKTSDIAVVQRTIGTPASIRLRDGSLRIGNSGNTYIIEDAVSIAAKLRKLRTSALSALAGVHIQYTKSRPWISISDMNALSECITSP